MKKTMLSLILVTGIAISVNAQSAVSKTSSENTHVKRIQNKTPEERAKREADKAEKDLSLTAEQKTKWQNATLERMKANEPLREKMQGSTTPDERKSLHQQMKTNTDAFDATVSGFLNPEQKTKWEQSKQDRKVNRRDNMKTERR
jgi:hypothetical protein